MRLIDVDKHFEMNDVFYKADFIMPLSAIKEVLKNTETVEAIPIEWVKRYASKKSADDKMDGYWHFWEEDVLKMIDDWEKENENV